jgi:AcrR family transcriptional regulator
LPSDGDLPSRTGPQRTTLRADARRNLERIMSAAMEVFAERGLDASTDEVARRAGVGHGTVFRRFPTKEDLIVAILERRLEDIHAQADALARSEDPWDAFRRTLELLAGRLTSDRAAFAALGSLSTAPTIHAAKERIYLLMGDLLRRAQDAGVVRRDLEPQDLGFLLCAAGAAVPFPLGDQDLWRRYLGVILDGMRPEGASPLSPPAPTAQQLERAHEKSLEASAGG